MTSQSQTPSLITLQCPNCGGKSAFHPWEEKLVCQYCGSEQALVLPTGRAGSDAMPRPSLRKPGQVQMWRGKNDALQIAYKWRSWKIFPLVFFVVFWDGFLCVWYSAALSFDNPSVLMLLFPILHLAVGVGMTYYLVAALLNTTTITVDREWFKVQHDPVPWPGEVKAPVEDLQQLYCQEKISRGKNSTTVTYKLSAVLKDGSKKDLLDNLQTPEVAGFIEQSVEKYLDIQDRRVSGEMPLM